jgi:Protein of unknown function (DUF3179)
MKFLIALTILTVALLLGPIIIALPPVNQTPAMLSAAHLAHILSPFASLALVAVVAFQLWRRRTWRTWVLLAVALGCFALSQVNLFDLAFAPARGAEITSIGAFHDVRDTDMVIGVVIGGQSRAYPVRYLAYHHMLNDQLGPIALLPTF